MLTNRSSKGLEFHVARSARERYHFDESLFSITGDVIFANFHGARVFAHHMNQKRDLVTFPEQAVKASQINAMGLIHELTHYMLRSYIDQVNPRLLTDTLAQLNAQLGASAIDTALLQFADQFPTTAVYRRETDTDSYLSGQTDNRPNREVVLEEMLMLWLENMNPAFAPFQELFDDGQLEKQTAYPSMMSSIYRFFGQAGAQANADNNGIASWFGGQNVIDLLRAPALAAPHSLEGQLEFIRERWGLSLGKFFYRLLGGLDLIKEENKPIFFGPGPVEIPSAGFSSIANETEQFTPDRDWMPRLVLIAKNAYVWLDQLSRAYGQPINTLDQVPDAELRKLARWGITGLWLIGLWERSKASQRIKQIMGNTDAVASAYSLFDYQIAEKLGGEAACANLQQRAWHYGIRLASDMVPNHVGIDGRWVIEHPDWFLSLPYPPYPSYSFNGVDLSWDARVGIFLEDHYYDRSDAAVVFKRIDRETGDAHYIYHGNDGTSIPWNDTAQLNYLKAEVREAIIQTILHVARQFPIIRFDAAMTLAKKHIERLWFPEPGSGGAIASRAEHAMTKAQFDALMPHEFWREVVDRAATEAPDTLLLAEAFWMMEGYFVRTLGMHRVYNSAFMHLLRDEDNAKYRSLIKNTLEFDPEILKRYVNFQNNPDERTAVDQFGKGDKYFGICTLMLTMPGLPMFGHGQIEGFTEKYGMEYQRAYWDEQPDGYLIERHEREIFPLAHKRYLFAEVENFLLYDFFRADGSVVEDVYAFSNRFGDERALVIYHNKYASASGWVRTSAAFSVRTSNGDERELVQRTLGEGLNLQAGSDIFYIFRDYAGGMEYIRQSNDLIERGLYVELGAYKCHVFLDFRAVQDDASHQYAHIAGFLAGRGVPSIDEALTELFLQPILTPFRALVNADTFGRLLAAQAKNVTSSAVQLDTEAPAQPGRNTPAANTTALTIDARELLQEIEQKMLQVLGAIQQFTARDTDAAPIAREVRDELAAILQLPALIPAIVGQDSADYAAAITDIQSALINTNDNWNILFSWACVHTLGKMTGADDFAEQSRSWLDEWLLGRIIETALCEQGMEAQQATLAVMIVKQLTIYQDWFTSPDINQAAQLLGTLLADNEVQQLLRVNRYQDIIWFDKSAFERLLWWMLTLAVVSIHASPRTQSADSAMISAVYRTVTQLRGAAVESGYQVEKLLSLVQKFGVQARLVATT